MFDIFIKYLNNIYRYQYEFEYLFYYWNDFRIVYLLIVLLDHLIKKFILKKRIGDYCQFWFFFFLFAPVVLKEYFMLKFIPVLNKYYVFECAMAIFLRTFHTVLPSKSLGWFYYFTWIFGSLSYGTYWRILYFTFIFQFIFFKYCKV